MKEEILFAKGIKIEKSIFDGGDRPGKGLFLGGRADFQFPIDCDLVILCGNKGGGYIPYGCLLPHQVYVDDLKKTFQEEGFEVIYALPVSSKNSIQVAFNGKYGKQRWEEKHG